MHCPVVISSLLSNLQKVSLLQILHMNKKAIGWKIFDLKGISPTVCTHHIYLEEESKAVQQPQRRVNSHMQEKGEEMPTRLTISRHHIPHI